MRIEAKVIFEREIIFEEKNLTVKENCPIFFILD